MYAGQIVEEARVQDLFKNPAHPYTKALLQTVPSILDNHDRKLTSISGVVPERYQEIEGCRFASRCQYKVEACEKPQQLKAINPYHYSRCHLAERILEQSDKEVEV